MCPRPRARRDLPTERWMFAVAGVLAGAAGLAASTALAWLLKVPTTPLAAVAGGVRDLTPGPLAVRLVHLVGALDKPLLVAGTASGALLLTLVAGLLARRHPLWSDLLLLLLAIVGMVAVAHAAGITAGLTIVVGFVVMIAALRALVAPLRHEEGPDPAGAGRRRFLRRAGMIAAGSGAVLALGYVAGRGRRLVERSRALVRIPGGRGAVPRGAKLPVPGLPPWRTPEQDFYLIDTALVKPSVQPEDWRLRIHGRVDHEVTFTYDELLALPPAEAWVTLACVSNEVGGDLIGNAWWTGVPVTLLLERAGILDGADAVLQTSDDGWTCLTPLSALTDGRDALVAYGMNGEPLSVEHGFPARMVVPGLYGYVSATKWLVDLEVTRFADAEGYWTSRGWSAKGPVKTQSRIDVPQAGATIATGRRPVGGVAWAQHTGIERVEYRLDDQPWREATLGRVPSTDTWVQWSGEVDLDPGDHELQVRATDAKGRTQTDRVADVLPDGATGWHTVRFDAAD